MPRRPRNVLDTSTEIKEMLAKLDKAKSDSDSDRHDYESEDTDSHHSSAYDPDEDELEEYFEEREEDEQYLIKLSQESADSSAEESDPALTRCESAASVFSVSGKHGRLSFRTTPVHRQRHPVPLPSPQSSFDPGQASTPFATGGTGEAEHEADTEDVGDEGRSTARVVRRRLYATAHKENESSDEDDPPPRIIFPPRRPIGPGEPSPSRSGVSRQDMRSRSPLRPATTATPTRLPSPTRATPATPTRLPPPTPATPSTASPSGDTERCVGRARARSSSRRAGGSGRGRSASRGRVSRGGRSKGATLIRRGRAGGRAAPQEPAADPLPGPIRVSDDWTWEDIDGFEPRVYSFTPGKQPGANIAFPVDAPKTRSYVFRQFMTENLCQDICNNTNQYNYYRKAGKIQHPQSLYKDYVPVTPAELYIFLALVILMGPIKKNAVHKYWTTDPLTATPGFNRVMGRNRFQAIMGNLHFIDSLASHLKNQEQSRDEKDPIEQIRPVYDYLRMKIKSAYSPHQKLVIDESLCLWRGNIGIRQYIPSKRHRYGLKTFVMCDCKTGYVQDVMIYMGGKTELDQAPADVGIAGAVVCTMLKDFVNEGRIIYTDNWYTSPSLCRHLDSLNTGSCGTVRRNRKYLPRLPSRREPDSKIYKQSNGVLLLSWMDNKEVNVLSTVHRPIQEQARRRQRGTGLPLQKPQAINDYNINMRLVDKKDQVVASAECARKTMRWYKKFFFHLLDLVLYNSHIIHRELSRLQETREEFCVELARELVIQYKTVPVQPAPSDTGGQGVSRLTERHFIALVPPTQSKPKPYRRCFVCSHTTRSPSKRTDTRYCCIKCDVGLCITPCFEDYHTLLHF